MESPKRLTRSAKVALWIAVLLVVLAPLPEGSANPWALAVVESLTFGLLAFWLIPLALGADSARRLICGRQLLLPLVLFTVVVTAQLAPMPPALLRRLSPETYRLYEISIRGWPRTVSDWRPFSIAPSMAARPLLKLAAYVSLFSFLGFYPFSGNGRSNEREVCRVLVTAVLTSGLIASVVGIVEFYTWNGKVLWLFVPYDWGVPQTGQLSRALGPFVNFDHFGNYLAVILPLAVGGALLHDELYAERAAFPLFCAAVGFLALCGLLLSASRGAWIAAAIALTILRLLARRLPQASSPIVLAGSSKRRLLRSSLIAAAVLVLSILFVGQQGRNQIDSRLQGTFQFDGSGGGRSDLSWGTLAMAIKHPLFGVGLGCWPELYSHYEAPPWSDVIYREAHNDYAQLLAETGVVGFGLVTWFFAAVWKLLHRTFAKRSAVSPMLLALCASLSAMAFHEFFDFSLQTPANAVLFIVLLALVVRIAMDGIQEGTETGSPSRELRVGAAGVSAFALVLIVCALRQDKTPYPYNINQPRNPADAIDLISAHPAEAGAHLQLLRLAGESLPEDERLGELRAAVWLDPNDPYSRDQYAVTLLHRKMTSQGFDNIRHSVRVSPSVSTHFYLSEGLVSRLTDQTQRAVEQGFREAIELGYLGAIQGLGNYYIASGRYVEAGDAFEKASQNESDSDLRKTYLMNAGRAYARVDALDDARKSFELAIRDDPSDSRPYREVTTLVFGPQHQLEAARNLIARGIEAGADAPALYQALAQAADADGNAELTEIALRSSVETRPTAEALLRLGSFYLNHGKNARAALSFRQATEIDPKSAEAYYLLGVAEQYDYAFSDAGRDFAQAVRLAPENLNYHAHYLEFQRTVAQSIKASRHRNE